MNRLKRFVTPFIHALFWIGYGAAFWGAFEMAYQSPNDPVWSGTFGFPFFHHYIYGFIMVGAAWVIYHLLQFRNKRRGRRHEG